ncbi:hypothetical protein DL96DRAFT_1817196 [Flagelloscypha sp. PMI_526]|nr:hypothetical protein DL96DRAFT_1817196 [Flagelloscypha sp. PMI_526]
MGTPATGTSQQHFDIERQESPRPPIASRIMRSLPSKNTLAEIAIISPILISGCFICALYILIVSLIGRRVLDAIHWKYTLPPRPPSPDGSDQAITELLMSSSLAGLFAGPGFWVAFFLHRGLINRANEDWAYFALLLEIFGVLVNGLAAVAASAAALHPRFQYIEAVSMAGMYGVGSGIIVGGPIVLILVVVAILS